MAKRVHPFEKKFNSQDLSGSGFNLHASLKDEKREIYEQLKKIQKDCQFVKEEAEQNIREFHKIESEMLLEDLSQVAFRALLSGKLPRYAGAIIISGAILFGGYSYLNKINTEYHDKSAYSVASLNQSPNVNSGSNIFAQANSRQKKEQSQDLESRLTENSSTYHRSNAYEIQIGKSSYIYFTIRGDTLSKIAKNISGNENNWKEIQRYNGLPSTLIEVNQALLIPRSLANNNSLLSDANLGEASSDYDGKTIPNRVILAEKNDSFEKLSVRAFGSSVFARLIYEYNCEINPRFSQKLYRNEHIFLPPKTYLVAHHG
jgi:hypothetical protein